MCYTKDKGNARRPWDFMSLCRKDKLFMEKYGFTFQKNLGEGRYGKVVRAYSNCMRKNFAVKIIDGKKIEDSSYLTKFLERELEIMKDLKHPNVLKTHQIFRESKNKVFVVMELCVNGDLSQYMEAEGPLSEECSRKFFTQLCTAVQYLHSSGVAHRDLKCENLLLDRKNNIKVCDFGMSRRLTYTDGRVELSKTFCGTESYAPPEILRSVPYNPTVADVWSMGVILYKMLYNALPFPSVSILRRVRLQMGNRVNFPDTPTISPQVVALIQGMLHPDMEYRTTVDDILESPWVAQSGQAEGREEVPGPKDDPGQKRTGQEGKAKV